MAKGIGILLVVMGHCSACIPLQALLTSFHMPLFFFLSGLFLLRRDEAFPDFAKKKARTLLFPCLTFGIILSTYSTCIDYLRHDDAILYGLRYVGLFINMRQMPFPGSLWFFPCLFLVEIFVYALRRTCKTPIAMIVGTLLLTACGLAIHQFYGKGLPWSIDIALYCMVFTIAGFLARDKVWNIHPPMRLLAFATLAFVAIVYANYSYEGDTVDLYSNRLGCYPLFYLAAAVGIFLTVIVSGKLARSKFLIYCGRNSMIIYALQFLFLRVVNKIAEMTIANGLLRQLVATMVVTFLLIPFINIVTHRFSWMTGQFAKPANGRA